MKSNGCRWLFVVLNFPILFLLIEANTKIKTKEPTTRFEMTLKAGNLPNRDRISLSTSDPFCEVFVRQRLIENFEKIGETEVVKNNINPNWIRKIHINHYMERSQKMLLKVWDYDEHTNNDLLVEIEIPLTAVVIEAQSNGVYIAKTGSSQIHIFLGQTGTSKQLIRMQFSATLGNRFFFLKRDSYIIISKEIKNQNFSPVFKSEVEHSSNNPTWKPMQLSARALCDADDKRDIRIDCYDKFRLGTILVGSCFTSLEKLLERSGKGNVCSLQNSLGVGGYLQLVEIKITEEVSFMDYVKAGLLIKFSLAIDYTASNVIDYQLSLHSLEDGVTNQYILTFNSVGKIIEYYNKEKKYSAYGFGAISNSSEQAEHNFELCSDPTPGLDDSVFDSITRRYKETLKHVTLSGPTYFAPVIRSTIENVTSLKRNNIRYYTILLIITDGQNYDMPETKEAIIEASELGISIIIVGVDEVPKEKTKSKKKRKNKREDNYDKFEGMKQLDSDGKLLCVYSEKKRMELTAKHDIVQFVELNKFLDTEGSTVASEENLAEEVLAELPDQLKEYFKLAKITLELIKEKSEENPKPPPVFKGNNDRSYAHGSNRSNNPFIQR